MRECLRLCIPPRCSRCLCEFVMSRRERVRRGSRRGGLATSALRRSASDWFMKRALRLARSLPPEQLALFVDWHHRSVQVGVTPSAEDAFDYLNELKAA